MRLYFIVIVLFAASAALFDYRLAAGYALVGLLLFVYSKFTSHRQKKALLGYLEELSYKVETVKKDHMIHFPVPMVIFRLDNEEIIWSNQRFTDMTGGREHVFEHNLSDAVPGFDTRWLKEGMAECPELQTIAGRRYRVFGNVVRMETEDQLLGNMYWMDVTELAEISDRYWRSRPVCILIVLDNYGELLGGLTEKEKSTILADIDEYISQWTSASDGILCRFDRDRYLHLVEAQNLAAYVDSRFSLLDSVREIVNSAGIVATLSIGIGHDGANFDENHEYAKLGVEMALSRGGDQAVVKDRYNFEFYGGKSTAQERRTKVRSRVTAASLEKLFLAGGRIFIMGHGYADYDSFGAAAGICCIARKLQKEPRMILDPERHGVEPIWSQMKDLPEYEGVFISPAVALAEVKAGDILVIVDTNRPDQLEVPELLTRVENVVVIDHHRRAAEYIQDATINFHEPYASSAAELVTELLQYTVEPADVLRLEAEALLAGIAMDTKNFTLRTGSRTFEAAAFLRRVGANTAEVKRMMQSDFEGTVARYDVIRQAELYREGIVISAPDVPVDRITASQAADELLNIAGIQASFVMTPFEGGISISARSIGDVNVQVVLEKLGGGGNRSTAGAQLKDRSPCEALDELKAAIDAYCEHEAKDIGQTQTKEDQ